MTWADQRIAVTEFAGIIDLDGDARQPLDHHFPHQAGIVAGATGHNRHLLQGTNLRSGKAQRRQFNPCIGKIKPTAQGISEATPLLEDLFLHVVGKFTFFGGLGIPLNRYALFGQRCAGKIRVGDPIACQQRDLLIFQKGHLAGVLQQGRNVAGNKHFPLTQPNRNPAGIAQARGDQLIRVILTEHHNRAGATQIRQRFAHGGHQIATATIVVIAVNEVDDHFGVGVTMKGVTFALQPTAQRRKVFDNAVLDNNKATIGAAMGVGVALTGGTVRGPTRMANR